VAALARVAAVSKKAIRSAASASRGSTTACFSMDFVPKEDSFSTNAMTSKSVPCTCMQLQSARNRRLPCSATSSPVAAIEASPSARLITPS